MQVKTMVPTRAYSTRHSSAPLPKWEHPQSYPGIFVYHQEVTSKDGRMGRLDLYDSEGVLLAEGEFRGSKDGLSSVPIYRLSEKQQQIVNSLQNTPEFPLPGTASEYHMGPCLDALTNALVFDVQCFKMPVMGRHVEVVEGYQKIARPDWAKAVEAPGWRVGPNGAFFCGPGYAHVDTRDGQRRSYAESGWWRILPPAL